MRFGRAAAAAVGANYWARAFQRDQIWHSPIQMVQMSNKTKVFKSQETIDIREELLATLAPKKHEKDA